MQSSGLTDNSEVKSGARVQDNSSVSAFSTISERTRVHGAQISLSEIGPDSIILFGSIITGAILLDNVVVFQNAFISSNSGRTGSLVIESGARIGEGAFILGPLTLLPNANIGTNTSIEGEEFIGEDFVIGRNSRIRPGGDILGNVRIGSRVDIGQNHRIGDNAIIENDVYSDGLLKLGNESVIRANSFLEFGVNIGDRSTVGLRANLGFEVTIGEDVVLGTDVTIGERAVIGNGVVITPGSVVPANAVVAAGTVY